MKITTKDFIKAVATKTGFKQTDIKEVLGAAANEVILNLRNGDETKLFQWLSIEPVQKDARKARNPKTGKIVDVPAKTSVKAKFGKGVKDAINS